MGVPSSPLPSPVAELIDVSVSFAGRPAVRSVDLRLAPHALTVIVGPNGAGKSTLLDIVAGVRRPDSGQVRIATASRAYVPQRTELHQRLPLTLRDVVMIGGWGRVGPGRRVDRQTADAVDAAIETLGLGGLQRTPFADLSGGQQQRALLAQGLARGADLLLLDEPTTALDRESSERILQAIAAETARGAAVLCVSHDPVVIAAADLILRLDGGRTVPS